MVMIYGDFCGFLAVLGGEKQSQTKPILYGISFIYNTEDCRGPSGLAMTIVGLLQKTLR